MDKISFNEFTKLMADNAYKSDTPSTGSFELTPLCNLDCKMCYVHLNREQLNGQAVLPVETWKQLLRDYRSFGPCSAGAGETLQVAADSALRVMSWTNAEQYASILPSDTKVTEAAGTLAMADMIETALTQEDYDALAAVVDGNGTFSLDAEAIAWVFDVSVNAYSVDENGMFYMNSEQEKRHGDSVLNESHFCPYSYFPRVEGLLDDGINAFSMEYQSVEFMKSLKPDIRECFEAYGVQNYVELLGTNEAPGAWYPMYSYTQSLSSKSKGGMIRDEIDEVKRNWLPQVIMSDDFASTWDAYMAAYQKCDPQDYFDILQRHVDQILR